ncbi:MAG TPA: CxxxxCH/CxxCH domain-containing protein [Geobacteraceae bacterium]
MFSRRRVNVGRVPLAAMLLALGIILGQWGMAGAAPQYTLSCISCHQMPPLDSATRDPLTGAFKGNHQAHATATVSSCVKCHGSGVTAYTTGHRTKRINMNANINSSPAGGAYSRAFFNQTSVPPAVLGNCSNVNCHFEAATPAWGGTAFAAPSDCSQCHLVAPNTGNHPVLGSKHGNYLGTGTGSCLKCHPDHLSDVKPFAHATSVANRGIKVQFGTAPNSGGTYSGNGLNFLPSQNKTTFGNCSNLYCHSDGRGGAPNTIPTWGTSLDCRGCHNSNLASGQPMSSGKHTAHMNNAGFIGTNYGCAECHASTANTDTHIANYANHVKGFVSISGARVSKNYNTSNKTCSTAYCHSDGKGNYKSIAWTSATSLDCTGCHGSDASPDPQFSSSVSDGAPNYVNAGVNQAKANSHRTHVKYGASDCASCHANTTTDGYSIKSGSTSHTNNTVEVYNGNGKTFTYSNDSTKTCSNVSCHNDGSLFTVSNNAPQWGGSLGCTGCHGDASTLVSNAHAKHVNTTTGKGYACDNCHNLTVSGSSTIVDPTKHGDGTVEVAGTNVTTWSGTATKTCASSCHLTGTPVWNNLASGACGTCHKALSTTANGLIATNAHTAHFAAAYGPGMSSTTATSCANCHVYTTDTAATHDDGIVNLAAGFNKVGTCTNCHKQTTNWTGGRVTCESCHTTAGGQLSVINGIPAPDKTQAATTGHGQFGKACTDCHDNNSNHISNALGTYPTRLTANLTGSLNTECKYCHDNGTRVATPAYRNMSTHFLTKGGGQAMACNQCHDPHGSSNLYMIRTSINGQNITFTDDVNGLVNTTTNQGLCQVCHTQTNYWKAGVPENNHPTTGCMSCHKHNAAGGAFKPNTACDSCHGYPPAPRAVTSPVTFGVQSNWSTAKFEDYSGGGGAHLVGAHIPATAKPSDGWANCALCHNGGRTSTTPYHIKALPIGTHINNVHVEVDPAYRFSDTSFIVYTGAKLVNPPARNATGSCFNVSCHFKPSPKWSIER